MTFENYGFKTQCIVITWNALLRRHYRQKLDNLMNDKFINVSKRKLAFWALYSWPFILSLTFKRLFQVSHLYLPTALLLFIAVTSMEIIIQQIFIKCLQ